MGAPAASMNVAWFSADARLHPFDDTPSLRAELGERHAIEVYSRRTAHDFVWRQFRHPAAVCVYELRDDADSAFLWPYLLHFPGILRLRSADVRHSRRRALQLNHRAVDDAAESAFAGHERRSIPVLASRLVVVGDRTAALTVQERYRDARIRYAPPLVAIAPPARRGDGFERAPAFRLGIPSPPDRVVDGAMRRARAAGIAVEPRPLDSRATLEDCDAVAVLDWPPAPEPPAVALCAMACARPVVVYETATTAGWPALDPQTWRPRGFGDMRRPIAIALDPRDTEHSLLLAVRRLAADRALRAELGAAAEAWTKVNAAPSQAAAAWEDLLAEAATLEAPPLPPDWPPHLRADGTARPRELLAEMGVEFPF